jgi:hypothetical protein
LRSPASGTATKRYLRLGNISDRENTIIPKIYEARTHSVPGFFMRARISACVAVASLHLRVVSMKEHNSTRADFTKQTQRVKCLVN